MQELDSRKHYAVLLANQYDEDDLDRDGSLALTGQDSLYLHLLKKANSKLDRQHAFQFFVLKARLVGLRRSEQTSDDESLGDETCHEEEEEPEQEQEEPVEWKHRVVEIVDESGRPMRACHRKRGLEQFEAVFNVKRPHEIYDHKDLLSVSLWPEASRQRKPVLRESLGQVLKLSYTRFMLAFWAHEHDDEHDDDDDDDDDSRPAVEESTFSWRMPRAHFPSNKQVEEFLRSDRRSMRLSGVFGGVREAREFIALNNGLKKTHSTEMTCSGIGRNTQVHIDKTRAFFETRQK
jgi:hypothetical protein